MAAVAHHLELGDHTYDAVPRDEPFYQSRVEVPEMNFPRSDSLGVLIYLKAWTLPSTGTPGPPSRIPANVGVKPDITVVVLDQSTSPNSGPDTSKWIQTDPIVKQIPKLQTKLVVPNQPLFAAS